LPVGYLAVNDEKNGNVAPGYSDSYPRHKYEHGSSYSSNAETGVGLGSTLLWLTWNAWYWYNVGNDLVTTTDIISHDEQLFWMAFKKATQVDVSKRKICDD
jgi:hypothetical protein